MGRLGTMQGVFCGVFGAPLSISMFLQVRLTARSFGQAGDHAGQQSNGYRWPFGPVGLITPFNFPLEIPALQLMGALFMGNKPLLHVDHRQVRLSLFWGIQGKAGRCEGTRGPLREAGGWEGFGMDGEVRAGHSRGRAKQGERRAGHGRGGRGMAGGRGWEGQGSAPYVMCQ